MKEPPLFRSYVILRYDSYNNLGPHQFESLVTYIIEMVSQQK